MLVQWVQLTSTSLQNIVMKAFLWTFVSQLRNTLLLNVVRCFFCAFYIKSQPYRYLKRLFRSYFFCAFYIKSQLWGQTGARTAGYFFCAFYIKSQPRGGINYYYYVISFAHSTSNHNASAARLVDLSVISFAHSTSNHNKTNIIKGWK